MPEKQKSAQKSRKSKTSSGERRGSRPVHLTELQKILICDGGYGHSVLRSKSRLSGYSGPGGKDSNRKTSRARATRKMRAQMARADGRNEGL